MDIWTTKKHAELDGESACVFHKIPLILFCNLSTWWFSSNFFHSKLIFDSDRFSNMTVCNNSRFSAIGSTKSEIVCHNRNTCLLYCISISIRHPLLSRLFGQFMWTLFRKINKSYYDFISTGFLKDSVSWNAAYTIRTLAKIRTGLGFKLIEVIEFWLKMNLEDYRKLWPPNLLKEAALRNSAIPNSFEANVYLTFNGYSTQ